MNGSTALVTDIFNTRRQSSFFSYLHSSFRQQTIPELVDRGDSCFHDGNYEDALHHYNNALKQERYSASNDDTLQASRILRKIGLSLSRTGDSFAAMNSLEDALRIQQEKLGPGSEDAAETTAEMLKILDEIRVQSGVGERQFVKGDNGSVKAIDVGTNLLEWGEYKEAEVVLKDCLDSMNDDDNAKIDEKIKVLGAMAELDRAQGKYDEAKERYLEVLKTAKTMNANSDDEVDISVITSIAGYAEILRKAGDLWQAEALHKKVRNMLMASKFTQKSEGEAGDDTALHLAISHTQLGCTVFALKKYEEAWQEHKSALNIRLRVLEVTDALVSESFNYCAETLNAMGREADALPLSLQAVEIRSREFGTSHPAYAHAICVLAKCYLGVGRAQDAMPLIEKCLEICEMVFNDNHANLIPNLIIKGDILKSMGELEKALGTYQRALSIHKANFKAGQQEFQLEECQRKTEDVMTAIKNEMAFGPYDPIFNREETVCAGTPVIVITDIGRDIDDAMAIVMLSTLKKMFVINPLAVIVTLAPVKDRACLARMVLDSLGMQDVPVGIGTDVGCPEGPMSLRGFNGVFQENQFQFERASSLMARVLTDAEPKSVKLLCLANLKDIFELTVKEDALFRTKVKEVVVMGGASYSEARQQLIPDETASNNSCDLEAARQVYAECQKNNIPTTTVSRYAPYGCPLCISFLDDMMKTNHLLAGEIRNANFKAMQELWKKVNMPSWMPGRGKLPSRCNREWFLEFFQVKVDRETDDLREIWSESALYLYDSIATLCCLDAYVDLHFSPKLYTIENTAHRLIGTPASSCVANRDYLVQEMEGLLHQTFMLSIEGINVKPIKDDRTNDEDGEKKEKSRTRERETYDVVDEKKETV
mmetsp:Transcript_40849/g.85836  ORF Transcript_40849/g.85836 Transcript_40849/m.85836 type:complete len:880 (+) Transcript_40849:206-2845(+)